MKYLKIAAILFVLVTAIFLLAPIFMPSTFKVQKELVIAASPELVFDQINNFKKWENWSPWLQRDSTITNTYSGTESGAGSKMTWKSNKSGEGGMEIIASERPASIITKVNIGGYSEFNGTFTLTAVDSGTKVVWVNSGNSGYLGRWFHLLADKAIGDDLQQGLINLSNYIKTIPMNLPYRLSELEMSETNEFNIYYVTDSCPLNQLVEKQAHCYKELNDFMLKNKIESLGAPIMFYRTWSPQKVVFEAAVPVQNLKVAVIGNIKSRVEKATQAVSVSYFGEYGYIPYAYNAVIDSIAAYGYAFTGPIFEVYVSNPTADAEKETKLFFPVK